MKSASKVVLDTATLARWSKKHLGKTLVGSREITDGWFNTIHVLALADGSQAVLKVSPPPTFQPMRYERDILATEVDVLRRMASAGLRVPRVLADCPDGDGLGHPWFIMEFVQGEPWNKLRKTQTPERCDAVDDVIGYQAALTNEIQGPRFGRWKEDHCASASWATSFLSMVEDLLADARDKSVPLPRSEAEFRELFHSARGELDAVTTPRLVVYDLHDGNVMIRPDTLELTAFLDPDRALWGDPLMDYYFRSVDDVSPAWHNGYRRACTDSGRTHPADIPGAERRLALYDVYLGLVLVIETVYREYDPEHVAWVRGLLDDALVACDALARPK